MSLPWPAVQVLPVPVKPLSSPGDSRWSDEVRYSPGAGLAHPKLYFGEGGVPLLTTSTPVQTTPFTTNSPASSIGDPTPTTVVQASTPMEKMLAPEGLSVTGPDSALPAATNSSDIITSSSSSQSPSFTSTTTSPVPSTTPQETSSPPISDVDFGNTTIPSMTPKGSTADAFMAGSTSGAKGSRLSGGAIAAVVIVFVLVMCAIAFFILRNRRIKRRVARRATWTAGLSSHLNIDSSLEKGVGNIQHPVSSDAPTAGPSQSLTSGTDGNGGAQAPIRNIPRKPPLPYSPVTPTATVPPSPQSYNNPPNHPASSIHSTNTPTIASASEQPVPMTVRVRFVPQLPDELAITPGETLYIQSEFDDGWALCANTLGKQGMVPLECLEGGGGQSARVSPWRTTRRASSLTVATWS